MPPPGSYLAERPAPHGLASLPPSLPAHGVHVGPRHCLCALCPSPSSPWHSLAALPVPALPLRACHCPADLLLYQPLWLSSTVQTAVWTFSRTPQHLPIIFKPGGGFTWGITPALQAFLSYLSACRSQPPFPPAQVRSAGVYQPLLLPLLFLAFSLLLEANFRVTLEEQ